MKRTYELTAQALENLDRRKRESRRTVSGELTVILEGLYPKVPKKVVYQEGFGGFCTVEEVTNSMVRIKSVTSGDIYTLTGIQLQYEFTNGPDSEETFKLV